jgi:hypothetical protein
MPIIPFAAGYDLRLTQSHPGRPEVLVSDNTLHVMRTVTKDKTLTIGKPKELSLIVQSG